MLALFRALVPISALLLLLPATVLASGGGGEPLDLTKHMVGYISLLLFGIAYLFVMAEEVTHLRKSKPVLLAAGIIWILIAAVYSSHDMPHAAGIAIRHNILEYAELFLFLLVAMTYINAMEERLVFQALRTKLVSAGLSFRQLFWITGALSFVISPVADNLTTALLMCAVVMALGKDNKKFVLLSCINIVVAANAGGAFSPFGDITTLMVWQKGIVRFSEFFVLFLPSLVNWLIPAIIMSFTINKNKPESNGETVTVISGLLSSQNHRNISHHFHRCKTSHYSS
jgi:Na+/H+ antiporter NhaD/arsenite permease-like protein